ncbi:DUF2946 domain-containing protein [Herbaspirillum sp. GCM10030257]|uniref:DUF2946 domain-containing protein n=1 Tax=Herbaspirillum sp. GCM10030257 TaxID=3273393 RepID=UPI0036151423
MLTAWVACFAILLVALAPSVSHALAAKRVSATEWIEICTLTGAKQVKQIASENAKPFSPAKHDQHSEDCPFCRIQGDSFGPPPTGAAGIVAAESMRSSPSLFYEGPRSLFMWAPAQSRAPPLRS